MQVLFSNKKRVESVNYSNYVGLQAIFKVVSLTKDGYLAQIDSFVLNSEIVPPIRKWFYTNETTEDFTLGDYILGQIQKIDPKKNSFIFTYKNPKDRITGCVLKLCNLCLKTYLLKKDRNVYTCLTCNQSYHYLQDFSIHYSQLLD